MKELVKSNITHNTELKTELLDTGDLILAEAGVDTHFEEKINIYILNSLITSNQGGIVVVVSDETENGFNSLCAFIYSDIMVNIIQVTPVTIQNKNHLEIMQIMIYK